MGLTYRYSFSAPSEKPSLELAAFLCRVESEAKNLGFSPTMVIKAEFKTPEQQAFARRLTTGLKLEHEKLKGVELPPGQVWGHCPDTGFCRVIPSEGVLLVVTNERGQETMFGFLRYPTTLKGAEGLALVETGSGRQWVFQDFVNSPDPRYRRIVQLFREAGYCDGEGDEFAPGKAT